MKKIVASALAVGLAVGFAGTADAASKKKQSRSQDWYAQQYPSATPRQLKNARAFDKGGEYYEQDSTAHPVGSRGWWFLKERERGGGSRF
jgi:hypothetical protein